MKRMHIITGSVMAALLMMTAAPASAQTPATAATCRTRVNTELSKELRLYRAMLIGKPYARHARINDVRYDKDGMAWIKTTEASTPWKNLDSVQSGLSWSDTLMDQQDEHTAHLPIRGIFETKRVTTSELLPYAVQSIRALDCRLEVICKIAQESVYREGDTPVSVADLQSPGCIKFDNLKSYEQCHIEYVNDGGDIFTYCEAVSGQVLDREISLLKLLTEYDAGYRSLLQVAGNFDTFLREMRSPLTGTIRQAAAMIGQLGRIPCFLSSCDIAPGTK